MTYVQEPLFQHARDTADGQIKTGSGRLQKVVLVNAATPIDGLVEFYDNTEATGTPIFELEVAAEQGSVEVDLYEIGGLPFSTGLYADLTGSGVILHTWFA